MKNENKKQLSIWIPEGLMKVLKKKAKAEFRSVTNYVVKLLSEK